MGFGPDELPATAPMAPPRPAGDGQSIARALERKFIRMALGGARDEADVAAYGECAAAQYALIRGYGFARHVRTTTDEAGSRWTGDAVFVISDALPDGMEAEL